MGNAPQKGSGFTSALMESGVTAEIPIETFGSVIGTHLGEGSIALSYTPTV